MSIRKGTSILAANWSGASGGNSVPHYSIMPTPDASNLGVIAQFVGTTDATYTNGYFYKCVSDGQNPATYSWEQTDVQPSGGDFVITDTLPATLEEGVVYFVYE